MNKVKVLIFIDWYVPGYKAGGPIRSMANMVAALKDSIDFTVVTRDRDYKSDEPYKNCGIDFPQLVDGATVYYLKPEELTLAHYRNLAKVLDYNVLYVNGMYSIWFSMLPVLLFKKMDVKTIVSPRGMLSEGSIGVKSFQKNAFLSLAKLSGFYSKVLFHCSNKEEELATQKNFGTETKTVAITNFSKVISAIQPIAAPSEIGLKLFQIARISPEKNQLKALEILQHVEHSVEFNLYGPVYNESYWEKCQQAVLSLPANVTVKWHGAVSPDKMDAIIASHHALFLPSTGENFGHVIAETLSAGRPVIISDKTPWQALVENRAGYAIPLENEAEFLKSLKEFSALSQIDFAHSCSAAQEYYSAQTQQEQLKQDYLNLFLE